MMLSRRLPLIALCLALGGTAVWAERADRDKPMQVEADRMQHDEQKQFSQFIGSVQATKGSLLLRAERLEVQQDAQGRQQARFWAAPGQRVFFRQKREGLNEFIEGEAEQIDYDSQGDAMTLQRRAEVRILREGKLADQIQGQRILYRNADEVMTVDGKLQDSSARQRVRVLMSPRSSASEPAPAPALRSSPAVQDGGKR
ncbi:MAG: Lipopolysaccharide export system protein LptA precursor [Pseudomonadota bacterium]|jgi:lipopolysaccharide export system protein LptA